MLTPKACFDLASPRRISEMPDTTTALDIEITPEMIEAGSLVLCHHGHPDERDGGYCGIEWGDADYVSGDVVIRRIYRAMETARLSGAVLIPELL